MTPMPLAGGFAPSMTTVEIHPDVEAALRNRRPVVALETAVLTTGLPREPLRRKPDSAPAEWNVARPVHLETMRAMIRAVERSGAVPVVIGVDRGRLRLGFDEMTLARLAEDRTAGKASSASLAAVLSRGGSAGMTVSATLHACLLPPKIDATLEPIRVFATGGVGGVHRNWASHPDISADLTQLARSPVCVVCSGAKSILDLPATLEALHTLGTPIAGYRTEWFPQFYARGSGELPLSLRLESAGEVAAWCTAHWRDLHATSAMLLCQPVPAEYALDGPALEEVIHDAERAARSREVSGDARTPFLLDELARRTSGRSLEANIALLINNARLAAEVAVALSRR